MLGFSKKKRSLGEAGWGYTALCTLAGLVYFSPVLWIILTAYAFYRWMDTQSRADRIRPTTEYFSVHLCVLSVKLCVNGKLGLDLSAIRV